MGEARWGSHAQTNNHKNLCASKRVSRNLTFAEIKLWGYLRAHHIEDVHFRKQHAIGNYIVDFCAPRKKLIIELDGSQHLEQEEYDLERTAFLESKGYRILRFWNNQVMNDIDGVIRAIVFAMEEK